MFKLLAVVAVVAAAGWNYMHSENGVQMSDLALANVEALAEGENSELPEECTAIQKRTCCIIGSTHHTWCEAIGSGAYTQACSTHSY